MAVAASNATIVMGAAAKERSGVQFSHHKAAATNAAVVPPTAAQRRSPPLSRSPAARPVLPTIAGQIAR